MNDQKIVIPVNGAEYELKLSMHRVQLLQELTGMDLLNSGDEVKERLSGPAGVADALYALAGGEEVTGLTRTEFADEIPITMLRNLSQKINAVFARDVGEAEPDAPGEGGSGNASD